MYRYFVATLAALILISGAAVATAQMPVSIEFGLTGGPQAAEVRSDLATETTRLGTIGAEVGVGTPLGIRFGLHYYRHTGDLTAGSGASALSWGLSANEIGASVEKHFNLLPMSPASPYLGAGTSYSYISLADDLGSTSLDASTSIGRVYGLAGVKVMGLGMRLRAGYAFGKFDSADLGLSGVPGADNAAIDYGGFWGSVSLLFGIF